MSAFFESRRSDSPYVEIIWRGHVEQDYSPVCPADVRWNLLFMKRSRWTRVSAEGATSQFVPKNQREGVEFLVIKFKLGVFMPKLPADDLLNGDAVLPDAAGQSFWLNGSAWQMPTFENVEAFVARLTREGLLVTDPVVTSVLKDQPASASSRTVQRRFLRSTGLTPKTIQQIERAQQATALLSQGVPILDAVYQLGYADQAHMTRSLRRFTGHTPAQIARVSQV
ncbi:MAG: AraC family transcriptional regulator [Anaerolineae bacterium]|nr:AraC family transcriptional regulator [Anaerolineae bacterium]